MPDFDDIKDAKKAIKAAQAEYYRTDPQTVYVVINGETVPVMCDERDGRIDFGLPSLWRFTGDTAQLSQWWLKKHPNSGEFKPREHKRHLGYQVNLQFRPKFDDPLFNFHLTVP